MAEDRGGDALIGFMLGAVVGAGVALLLAPAKGEDTREALADWMRNAGKKGENFLREQGERLSAERERVEAALRAGKQAYRRGVEGGESSES